MSGIPAHLDGFYLDEHGDVWRLQTYCERPTMTLVRVGTHEVVGGAVGAPIFDRFTKLVRVDTAPPPTLEASE